MLTVDPPVASLLSHARKQFASRLGAALLALLTALALSGCRAPSVAPSVTTPARSLTGPSSSVVQVQSSPLYRQARQECQRHDYLRAAGLLDSLAKTPGLAPEAAEFVQQQKALCLKDAGQTAALPATAPAPAPSPTDSDCGPRALLLLCRSLSVKTDLATLRKTAGTTAQGTTMEGLQQAAQKLGLKAEGVQVSREALPDISTPAIAWDRRHHFIFVRSLSGRGEDAAAIIHDPNAAEETISQESLLQRCGGYLLLIHR